MEPTGDKIKFLPHHEQKSLCTTRPPYRQGRKLTAVKVYTVNDESVHLLIHGVPSIGLLSEVSMLCERYGRVKSVKLVDQYSPEQEDFTNVYHVQYERIQSARFAKKILDNRSFFGGVLHVCYAPELETIQQTKLKLVNRKKEIARRTRNLALNDTDRSSHQLPSNSGYMSLKSATIGTHLPVSTEAPSSWNPANTLFPTCCPTTSFDAGLDMQASPLIGPVVPSNSQVPIPTFHPDMSQEFYHSNPSTSQDTIEYAPLNALPGRMNNISNSRKRPFPSSSLSAIDTKGSKVSMQQHCHSISSVNQNLKRKSISTVMQKESLNTQQQQSPGIVTHSVPIQPRASQQADSSKLPAPQGRQTSTSAICTSDNKSSSNSLKRLSVGPTQFLPRSLAIKKKKK